MATLGRLQHIKLKGFRSIRELDLELLPLNILIGSNGAGKSNFISFFKFMNKLLEKELQLHVRTQLNGADRTLFFGRKTTDKLEIDLHFSQMDTRQCWCRLPMTGWFSLQSKMFFLRMKRGIWVGVSITHWRKLVHWSLHYPSLEIRKHLSLLPNT